MQLLAIYSEYIALEGKTFLLKMTLLEKIPLYFFYIMFLVDELDI